MDPATQEVHPVLDVTVHKVDRRVPAAQTVHILQVAALVTVLNVDPATQAVQARFVVTVHAVDAYVPAKHVLHVKHEAALVVIL